MQPKIGILSAMKEEINTLLSEMSSKKISHHGMREFHEGLLWNTPCVLVFSRWGKVAAACTATELLSRFQVSEILFTGVAGGVAPHLDVGDVVVGKTLVQHDMDARPLYPRNEIPLLSKTFFETNPPRAERLVTAAQNFSSDRKNSVQVHAGEIASGDRFFADAASLDELRKRLPHTLCVEMEGAAVAQVCHEYAIPFSIFRTISDSADEKAPMDFSKFVKEVASHTSFEIVKRWLN